MILLRKYFSSLGHRKRIGGYRLLGEKMLKNIVQVYIDLNVGAVRYSC